MVDLDDVRHGTLPHRNHALLSFGDLFLPGMSNHLMRLVRMTLPANLEQGPNRPRRVFAESKSAGSNNARKPEFIRTRPISMNETPSRPRWPSGGFVTTASKSPTAPLKRASN